MLVLNGTKVPTDLLKDLSLQAAELTGLGGKPLVVSFRSQKGEGMRVGTFSSGAAHRDNILSCYDLPSKFQDGHWDTKKKVGCLLEECVKQNYMWYSQRCEDRRITKLQTTGGMATIRIPKLYGRKGVRNSGLREKGMWYIFRGIFSTLVHEFRHVWEFTEYKDYWFSHENGNRRRPTHGERPEEKRAYAVQKYCLDLLDNGALPEVELAIVRCVYGTIKSFRD